MTAQIQVSVPCAAILRLTSHLSSSGEPTQIRDHESAVETPEAGDLDYIYDFSSIFATPEQEKLFTRPYRTYNNRI